MARNGSGVYSLPAGSTVANGTTITASQHNDPLADLEADMNTARPIVAGGTGASTAATARTNLGVNDMARGHTTTTRAALVTWVGSNTPVAGAIHSDGTALYKGSTGATAISDLAGLVPYLYPSLTQFGAVGDGTTDNRTKMVAALADIWDAPLHIDAEGTFDLNMTVSQAIPLQQYAHVVGLPGSSIVLNATGAGTTQMFGEAADVTLERLRISANHATSGETLVLWVPLDNNRLLLSRLDGGVTDAGATPSHIAHAINVSDDDVDGFLSFGNHYTRLTRAILKNTASTNTHKNFLFLGDRFSNMAGETMPFNNPNGVFQGIIGSCLFGANSIASDVGNSDHFFGGANVEGLIGSNFWVVGEYGEPLHVEEGTRLFAFTNVAAKLDDANSFFSAQDFNAAGSYTTPELGVVGNFVAERTARGSSVFAIDMVNDASGEPPLLRSIIHNGIVTGWESPGRNAEDPYTVAVHHVMAHNCGEAWQFKTPTLMFHDNYAIDCDAGHDLDGSGFIGKSHFYRTAGWNGTSSTLFQSPSIASGHSAGLTEWSAEQEGITCAAAATNYILCSMGAKMVGRIEVSVSKSSTVYCDAMADIKWDGTTLTASNVIDEHAGLSFVDFRNDGSGNLAIRINTGSQQTGCFFQVNFRGRHRFA